MSNLNDEVNKANEVSSMNNDSWGAIDPNYVARMRLQNRFKTGIKGRRPDDGAGGAGAACVRGREDLQGTSSDVAGKTAQRCAASGLPAQARRL